MTPRPHPLCDPRGAFTALALLPSLLVAQPSPPPKLSRVAFTGVSVVNVETGAIEPARTVLVAEGRIVRVERGTRSFPRDVILIPGLWDMHVHLAVLEVAPSRGTAPVRNVAEVERSVDMFARVGAAFVKAEAMSAEAPAASGLRQRYRLTWWGGCGFGS
jgi:hypothetical protein